MPAFAIQEEIRLENQGIIQFEHFGFQYTAQAEPTLYDINLTIRKGENGLLLRPYSRQQSS